MTAVSFHRPARTWPPEVTPEKVQIPAPPQQAQDSSAQAWLYLLLPLLSSVSMGAYLVTFGRLWMILLGVGFIVVSVGVTLIVRGQTQRHARRQRARQRGRYQRHLVELRTRARQSAVAQRAAVAFAHPHPARLWSIATGRRRVWERRPTDPDFLQVRIGTGRGDAALRLQLAEAKDPTVDYDRWSQRAARRLANEAATVPGQPAWVDLARVGVLSVLGPTDRTRAVVRGLLTQLAVLHGPEEVRLAVLAGDESAWAWTKWLPHCRDGAAVLVSLHLDGISDLLEARLDTIRADRAERAGALAIRRGQPADRHLVVVLDGYGPQAPFGRHPLVEAMLAEAGPESGLHLVCLVAREADEPGRVDARAQLPASGGLVLSSRTAGLVSAVTDAVPDAPDITLCEQTARALTPLRVFGDREQLLTRSVSLPEMLGCPELTQVDPPTMWRAADDPALLRVPIGVTADGADLVLDLKESAQGGVGPHGLLVGATGSGKSELLRTLVTGLALTHSPEHLGMVLVDFKGGATFAGVTGLPHVAGLITNLADDTAMVERTRLALIGEQQRRQQLLRDAGNVDNVREYQLRRAAGGTDPAGRPLDPLPYLMIIVDEFGELLTQRSDFIALFVQIGRLGRSLGMHLLLASQRLDEGKLRGLESHLSYRIALRTFSATESRAVIGTPDAYRLPPIPGSAYFKVGEAVYERFRVAHVSAPYLVDDPDAPAPRAIAVEPVPFGLRTPEDAKRAVAEAEAAQRDPEPEPVAVAAPGAVTELQVIVDRIVPYGPPVHQVWLPPLPAVVELDSLFGELVHHPQRGYHAPGWAPGLLRFPIGVVDLPDRQEQRVMAMRIDDAGGHIALVGAPQTGKSTLLRTAMLAAMLSHTPAELQFTAIDFGGGTLGPLAGAPHVTGVAVRTDLERVRRALAVAHQLLVARERLFAELGIDGIAEFRRRRDTGELPPGTDAADHVLVIDNWVALRGAVDAADATILDISARGLGVGVHLLMTANRWAEIRINLRDNIGGRLELRLNEPGESEISRAAARGLVSRVAGRGISPPGNLFQTAVPRLDGIASVEGLALAQQAAVAELAAGWSGPAATELRALPASVTVADLDTELARLPRPPAGIPIGLREHDLGPATVRLAPSEPYFLVLGDSGSGKTSFLRAWMRQVAAHRTPEQIRFMLLDYRGGLADAVPEPYIGARAGNSDHAAAYLGQLAETLAQRKPPADLTTAQRRARTWWSGPELCVVVDDYDLVAGANGRGPLTALTELLGQASDLGLRIVLARRVSGVSRALMTDPILTRLREYGAGGLILSGDPREGALLGDQRATRREPGRGTLIVRGQSAQVIQAVHDPFEDELIEDDLAGSAAAGVPGNGDTTDGH
ncbi:type VII secretion protein EccCa [Micromonospora sp. NBC_01813]|uniref:type VII secretion protein EccCa n=1 Tax=Micromonospora sp. NBC_01813 TaxID=2975988 RepID=UPI002DD7B6E0|nr:type VII secretion protein EccCa [Micromonospora sp. NBC_01813]WSA12048.1 type VII secretion protein EccCa [Micromonospora sp. NBC_01813]